MNWSESKCREWVASPQRFARCLTVTPAPNSWRKVTFGKKFLELAFSRPLVPCNIRIMNDSHAIPAGGAMDSQPEWRISRSDGFEERLTFRN